jgi:hypothetical protein
LSIWTFPQIFSAQGGSIKSKKDKGALPPLGKQTIGRYAGLTPPGRWPANKYEPDHHAAHHKSRYFPGQAISGDIVLHFSNNITF